MLPRHPRALTLCCAVLFAIGMQARGGVTWASPRWQSLDEGPYRSGACIAPDTKRNRLLVAGGATRSGLAAIGLWSFSLEPDWLWAELPVSGTPLDPEWLLYDAALDRLLAGQCDAGPAGCTQLHLWILDLATSASAWREIVPSNSPPAGLTLDAPVFDRRRERLLFFGGSVPGTGGLPFGTRKLIAFDLSGAQWSILGDGAGPSARFRAKLAIDESRDLLVVHGGFRGTAAGAQTLVDTWADSLSTGAWTEVTPTQVPFGGVGLDLLRYDQRRARVFGLNLGQEPSIRYDLVPDSPWTWEATPLAHEPDVVRSLPASFAQDSLGDRILFLNLDGVWAGSPSDPTWRNLAPPPWTPPPPYRSQKFFHDDVRSRWIVFGSGESGVAAAPGSFDRASTQLWQVPALGANFSTVTLNTALDHATDRFRALAPGPKLLSATVAPGESIGIAVPRQGGVLPPAPGLSSVWNPEAGELVTSFYDIQHGAVAISPATLSWRTGPLFPDPHLVNVTPMVPDLGRHRALMLVKTYFDDGSGIRMSVALWGLSLDSLTWSPVSSAPLSLGEPPAIGLVLDSNRDRLIAGNPPNFQTYSFAAQSWSPLTVDGESPPSRVNEGLAYDPSADEIILFGGSSRNDTWILPLGSPAPAPTIGVAAPESVTAGDSLRITLRGRNSGPGPQMFAFSVVSDPAAPGVTARRHAVLAAGAEDTVEVVAAIPTGTPAGLLHWKASVQSCVEGSAASAIEGTTRVASSPVFDPPAPTSLRIDGFRPNPARGLPVVAFSLGDPGDVVLDAFDVAGRRLWTRTLRGLPAGPHRVSLTGVDALGGRLVLRLTQGGRTVATGGLLLP